MCDITPMYEKEEFHSNNMISTQMDGLKLRIHRTNIKPNIEEEFRKKGFEFCPIKDQTELKNNEIVKDEPILIPYLCEIIEKPNETNPTFDCTKCTKKFASLQLLKQHQMVHSNEKPFSCTDCGKKFKKASHLKSHRLTHSLEESPYKCTQCEKIFTQDASLKLHMQKHRGIRPFLCKCCGKSFPKLYTLQRHERTHDEERMIQMREERILKNREKYGPPDKVEADKVDDNGNSTDKNENLIETETDYKEIVNEISINMEVQQDKSDIAPYLCEVVSGGEENKQFQCLKCFKRFSRITYLRQHQMTHSDYKPFPCTECPMRFKKASHLKTHSLTHAEDSPYKCDLCGKKFTQEAGLKSHLLAHSGIKPHICKECGKKFTKLYTLQRHEQTHSDARPFQCNLCYKKFSDISNLKRHEMTHSDNKPYLCSVCKKRFSLPCQLKRHQVTHEIKQKSAESDDSKTDGNTSV